MKKIFYLSLAGLIGLVSCTDDSFAGNQSQLGQQEKLWFYKK